MDHFAGLDVSVKDTSVCIVDETGKIVREVKVASEPEALLAVLKNPAYHVPRPDSLHYKSRGYSKFALKDTLSQFFSCDDPCAINFGQRVGQRACRQRFRLIIDRDRRGTAAHRRRRAGASRPASGKCRPAALEADRDAGEIDSHMRGLHRADLALGGRTDSPTGDHAKGAWCARNARASLRRHGPRNHAAPGSTTDIPI